MVQLIETEGGGSKDLARQGVCLMPLQKGLSGAPWFLQCCVHRGLGSSEGVMPRRAQVCRAHGCRLHLRFPQRETCLTQFQDKWSFFVVVGFYYGAIYLT